MRSSVHTGFCYRNLCLDSAGKPLFLCCLPGITGWSVIGSISCSHGRLISQMLFLLPVTTKVFGVFLANSGSEFSRSWEGCVFCTLFGDTSSIQG
jgi:hypothetical protein